MSEKTLPYKYMIGLEIHCELATQTKMFCRCKNAPFGAEPNQYTCPVCVGLPGTLPVPNKEAVKRTIFTGLALGCEIAKLSKWDRKHYFYPDLPKGYQISQFDLPICVGGELDLLSSTGEVDSRVRFERIHLEEDAGKLMHTGKKGFTRVDLNRAGVPLMEMVTKPDLTSPLQARAFLQELRLLVRTLGVSEADMEKGQMRCDVNVSILVEEDGVVVNGPITEIKNVNSTRAVERSIAIEAQRQYDEWMAHGPIRERKNKLTANWDEDKNTVSITRSKEAAHEYRYFPEPDIPPLSVYDLPDLNPEGMILPELPNALRLRYLALGLKMPEIEIFLGDSERRLKFEACVAGGVGARAVANWLVNAPVCVAMSEIQLKELILMSEKGEVSFAAVKGKLDEILAELSGGSSLKEILQKLGLIQEFDLKVVEQAIADVLKEQEAAVADYKAGNNKILGFIVGQVLKKAAGKAQPAKVQELVVKALV